MPKQETLKRKFHDPKIGLEEKNINEIAGILNTLLADINALFLKTLNCHWNMEDPRFYFLHELLDEQYHELLENMDEVAERIRKIGRKAPASLQKYSQLMRIDEILHPLSANEMLENLNNSYDQLIRVIREDISKTTNLEDFGTADMLTQLIRDFEKRAWILRSHLTKS